MGAELTGITPRRGTAVDVGCGTGRLTGLLAEHFTHVIGVDPGEDQLAHAAPADGIDCVHGTAEDLPVADGSADLTDAWGEPSRRRDVVWPITVRAGRLDGES